MDAHEPGNRDQDITGELVANRYQCQNKLGSGGMGDVYLAEDTVLGRQVVLKLLKESERHLEASRRFMREAKILSRLNHPHIVTVHDFGEWQSMFYIVMEYLEGVDLRTLIKSNAPFPPDQCMSIVDQILEALEVAHEQGVVHRDLKPANVFCLSNRESGHEIKILDFGLAISQFQEADEKLTQTGEILGTPHYMAPEQIMGKKDLTGAVDMYALGIMIYEMLSGDVPFSGDKTMEIFLGHLYKQPAPFEQTASDDTSLHDKLIQTANTCMKKNPQDRFDSIAALRTALQSDETAKGRTIDTDTEQRAERYKKYLKGSVTELAHQTRRIDTTNQFEIALLESETVAIENTIAPLLSNPEFSISRISTDNIEILLDDDPCDMVLLNADLDENTAMISKIRGNDRWSSVPFAVCGPDDDLLYISKMIENGASDYLAYPFEPEEVLSKIHRILLKGS